MKKTIYILLSVIIMLLSTGCDNLKQQMEPIAEAIYRITINYEDTCIDVDLDELNKWQTVLEGEKIKDDPSCGFSSEYSMTVYSEEGITVLYFAMDGCPMLRIEGTDSYWKLSEENKNALHSLLKEYGVSFPLI